MLLRVNLSAPILAFCGVIFIFILIEKKWGLAVKTFISFICGFILAILPFLIYCYTNGILLECFKSAYTIQFTSTPQGIIERTIVAIKSLSHFKYSILFSLLIFVTCCYRTKIFKMNLNKTNIILVICIIFAFIMNAYVNSISGRSYPHYATSFIPLFIIPMSYLFFLIEKRLVLLKSSVTKPQLLCVLAAILIIINSYSIYKTGFTDAKQAYRLLLGYSKSNLYEEYEVCAELVTKYTNTGDYMQLLCVSPSIALSLEKKALQNTLSYTQSVFGRICGIKQSRYCKIYY